jgi:thiol-disulfide isomerase/thioredoxin
MRNILLWALAISFFLLVSWMTTITVDRLLTADEAKVKITSLKSLQIVAMDSSKYELHILTATVVILFNTTCEHCQYEATEIKKSISFFEKTSILMISSEPIKTIKAFAEEYGLNSEANITFAKINRDDVFETFGSVSIPCILIYNKSRNLVKEFKGETRIEAILQYLPQ